MKKSIVVGIIAILLVILPPQAHASVWSDFTSWVRNDSHSVSTPSPVSSSPAGISIPLNAGQSYMVGITMQIPYSGYNFPANTVFDIKLATRALVTNSTIYPVMVIASGISGGAGVYNWSIPSSLIPANNYLILICASGTTNCDHSITFTISPSPSSTPTPTGSTISTTGNHTAAAAVFYSIGELLDKLTH